MIPQGISETQRLLYLQAMGIEAWVSRERVLGIAAELPHFAALDSESEAFINLNNPQVDVGSVSQEIRYEIGPGSGQTLLLCDSREQASSPLASDIARCLDEVPVWGWRERSDRQSVATRAGLSLESAIEDRLFTHVLVFSSASVMQSDQQQVIGSARVIRAPALSDLANNPAQKRALWSQLVQHGWYARRG